jgi:hypothetical protein
MQDKKMPGKVGESDLIYRDVQGGCVVHALALVGAGLKHRVDTEPRIGVRTTYGEELELGRTYDYLGLLGMLDT